MAPRQNLGFDSIFDNELIEEIEAVVIEEELLPVEGNVREPDNDNEKYPIEIEETTAFFDEAKFTGYYDDLEVALINAIKSSENLHNTNNIRKCNAASNTVQETDNSFKVRI